MSANSRGIVTCWEIVTPMFQNFERQVVGSQNPRKHSSRGMCLPTQISMLVKDAFPTKGPSFAIPPWSFWFYPQVFLQSICKYNFFKTGDIRMCKLQYVSWTNIDASWLNCQHLDTFSGMVRTTQSFSRCQMASMLPASHDQSQESNALNPRTFANCRSTTDHHSSLPVRGHPKEFSNRERVACRNRDRSATTPWPKRGSWRWTTGRTMLNEAEG